MADGADRCPDCGMILQIDVGLQAPGKWQRWRSLLDVDVSHPSGADPSDASLTHQVLEAAADPQAVQAHPLTLRFASQELEAAFTAEYQRASVRHIRFALAMALFLVAAFGLLDSIIQPSIRRELWLIRYGMICPVIAVNLVLTFVPKLRGYIEWLLSIVLLVTGGGILAMILISPAPGRYLYYAGLILVIMYTFTFMKLRFALASAIGWAIVGLYIAGEIVMGQTPWPILLNNMFFFVSATVIGMFAAYFFEALARRSFVQDKLVRRAVSLGAIAWLRGWAGAEWVKSGGPNIVSWPEQQQLS